VPLIVNTRGENAIGSGRPLAAVTPIATVSAMAGVAPIRSAAQATTATTTL
jgi:hypothetical protein